MSETNHAPATAAPETPAAAPEAVLPPPAESPAPETPTPETPVPPATPAEPSAPAAPATPEGFKPMEEMDDAEFLKISNDPARLAQYEAWLANPTAAPEAPAPAEPAPADPAAPVDPAAPAVDPEDANEAEALKRIRVGFLPEAERRQMNSVVQIMRAEPGLSLIDAIARVTGKSLSAPAPAAPPAQPPAEPPATPAPKPDPTAEIDTKIAEVKTKLAKAKADFDTEAEIDLTAELAELFGDKKLAAYKAEQAESTAATAAERAFTTEYEATVAQAAALYPDQSNPESQLSKEIAAEIQRLDAIDHPIFQDARYPLMIAGMVAARLGIAPKAATPAPPAPAAPSPTPISPAPAAARPARPVPPTAGPSAAPGTPMDAKTAEAALEKLSPEQLDELARAVS